MAFSLPSMRKKCPSIFNRLKLHVTRACFSYPAVLHWTVITIFRGQKKLLSSYLNDFLYKLHGYTVHQTMLKPFHYQLMHIMLKKTQSY